MTNVEVMDVSSTSPSLGATKSSTGAASAASSTAGRSVPGAVTLLLALTPGQARTMEFLSQNEAISVVQPDQEVNPPPVGQCIGTDQTTTGP